MKSYIVIRLSDGGCHEGDLASMKRKCIDQVTEAINRGQPF